MLHRVALVRADVSEELSASFIRVTRIGELGTTRAVNCNRRTLRLLVTASVFPSSPILVTLMKEALSSSETSVITRATRRNISEDTNLHSNRRENLKSYTPCRSFARSGAIKRGCTFTAPFSAVQAYFAITWCRFSDCEADVGVATAGQLGSHS
jgi:hypothetical protein